MDLTYINLIRKFLLNHFIIAVYLLSFTTFLIVSLISYHPNDPSFILATNQTPQNFAGQVGAYTADMIISWSGGIGAITIITILSSWIFIYLVRKKISFILLRLIASFTTLICHATMANMIAEYYNTANYGGILGLVFTEISSQYQIAYFEIYITLCSLISFSFALGLTFVDYQMIVHKLTQKIKWLIYKIANIIVSLTQWLINKIQELIRFLVGQLKYLLMTMLAIATQSRTKLAIANINTENTLGNPLDNNQNMHEIDNIKEYLSQENLILPVDNTQSAMHVEPYITAVQPVNRPSSVPKHERQKSNNMISNGYELPSLELFSKHSQIINRQETTEQLRKNANELLSVLNDFGIKGNILEINQGPVVTLYEFEPSAGTKSSRIIGLADDIARTLCAISTRIAVISGRNVLGIELPNKHREIFYLRELLATNQYNNSELKLPIILGKDLGGKPYIADLAKMPHLLVAGTTGSGKSVAINVMILSLLYRYGPESCKFIMIDPKMLELSVYDNIPHLLTPVVTEPAKAVVALKWAVKEMENRYRLMSNLGVRNIDGYNMRITQAIAQNTILERTIQTGFDLETGKPLYESVPIALEKLPYIVIIVDEMADLMLVAGKDIESSIQRLAQMARAAGIHIIMATQRPSVDVITGVIKANFPSRISFKVTSKIDSRTILGEQGAEQLLGQGDMLYMGGATQIHRVHCPFVADDEVERIASYLKSQALPEYITAVTENIDDDKNMDLFNDSNSGNGDDELYRQAVNSMKRDRKISTSYVQKVFSIGYIKASKIVDRMEKEGLVSAANHVGKRDILVD